MGRRMRNVMVLVLLVFALAVVAQARVNLQITEIYAGTSPKTPGGTAFDTSEWFEVTNFGATAADMVANPVYYDDESASPTKNTQLLGVDTIAAGESVIFFVDWESDLPGADDAETLALAYSLFATAWGPLPGIQIGYCDTTAGGLGTNGDTMYLFDSNLAGANIIDTAGYTGSATSTYVSQPNGTWNGSDGGPVSNDLAGSPGLAGRPWFRLVTRQSLCSAAPVLFPYVPSSHSIRIQPTIQLYFLAPPSFNGLYPSRTSREAS